MSEVLKIIDKGDRALQRLKYADKILYKKVLDILENNTNNGIVDLSVITMTQIEDLLLKSLIDSDFFDDIQNYLVLYNSLDIAYIEEQAKVNKLRYSDIQKLINEDLTSKAIRKTTEYALTKQGIQKSYMSAIADLVREQNYYQRPLIEAKKLIKQKLIETSSTLRYVNQVAMDSMRQYDGAFNDKVRDVYDFKSILYIGDLIETSRPFCSHILDVYDGRITIEQMKKALQEYCPNGNPSKAVIYVEIDGNLVKTTKGAGMFKGTTIKNICQHCGGYNCRHRGMPTK